MAELGESTQNILDQESLIANIQTTREKVA